MRYLERVPPFGEVGRAVRFVFLQRATADFAEEGHDSRVKREHSDDVVAGGLIGAVSFRLF